MNIQLPPIEGLSEVLSIIPLVIIIALILVTLTARSIIHSRAFTILAIAAIFIGGSASIVGGLQALSILIGVTGSALIGLIVTLQRSPSVLNAAREVALRRMATVMRTQDVSPAAPKQLAAPRPPALLNAPRGNTVKIPRGMGFDE
jgi:hypothetical protein